MKRISAELKRIARENLNGRYGTPMGAMVVSGLILFLIYLPFSFTLNPYRSVTNLVLYQLVSIVIGMLGTVISAGLARIHMKLSRNGAPQFSDLFYAFTARPDRFILCYIILAAAFIILLAPGVICTAAAVILESIPLLALAVIFYLAAAACAVYLELTFALNQFLLLDNPDMGSLDAFRESARLMKGSRGRLFYIQLSFIGWTLLGFFSCYIGMLWISPYIQQTFVIFYRDLIGELDAPHDNKTQMNQNYSAGEPFGIR